MSKGENKNTFMNDAKHYIIYIVIGFAGWMLHELYSKQDQQANSTTQQQQELLLEVGKMQLTISSIQEDVKDIKNEFTQVKQQVINNQYNRWSKSDQDNFANDQKMINEKQNEALRSISDKLESISESIMKINNHIEKGR